MNGTWNERVNGHDLHGFEGNTITTYAVYNDRGRLVGDYESYDEAYAACWGLTVVDVEAGNVSVATLAFLMLALVPVGLVATFVGSLVGAIAGTF